MATAWTEIFDESGISISIVSNNRNSMLALSIAGTQLILAKEPAGTASHLAFTEDRLTPEQIIKIGERLIAYGKSRVP